MSRTDAERRHVAAEGLEVGATRVNARARRLVAHRISLIGAALAAGGRAAAGPGLPPP